MLTFLKPLHLVKNYVNLNSNKFKVLGNMKIIFLVLFKNLWAPAQLKLNHFLERSSNSTQNSFLIFTITQTQLKLICFFSDLLKLNSELWVWALSSHFEQAARERFRTLTTTHLPYEGNFTKSHSSVLCMLKYRICAKSKQ